MVPNTWFDKTKVYPNRLLGLKSVHRSIVPPGANVQKALNRGKSYHRMRSAISDVNSDKFRVKTEAEQQIWNECSRLIANAIIFYNTLLLSRGYEQKAAAGDLGAIKILQAPRPPPGATSTFSEPSTSTQLSVLLRRRCHIWPGQCEQSLPRRWPDQRAHRRRR